MRQRNHCHHRARRGLIRRVSYRRHTCHFNIPSPPEDRQGSNHSSIQVTLRFGTSPGYPYAPQKAGKQQQLKAEPHYDD